MRMHTSARSPSESSEGGSEAIGEGASRNGSDAELEPFARLRPPDLLRAAQRS